MTKKELIDALEKYDDENEIEFYYEDGGATFELDSIEESIEDYSLRLRLKAI